MKKILAIILAFSFPLSTFAMVTVPWAATSTTQGWISPLRINGIEQSVFGQNFIATSTSLANIFPTLFFTNATGTNATTTNFAISSLSAKIPYAFPSGSIGALTIGSGLSLTNGTLSNSAQPTFSWPFTKQASGAQATSTVMEFAGGFMSDASSTLQDFSGRNATTTNFNITSNHLSFGSNLVSATTSPSFNVASTTLDALGKSFSTGTTSLILAIYPETRILRSVICVASSTGSVVARFGDGTTWTNDINCSTTGRQTNITSNGTIAAFSNFVIEIGTSASSPSRVTLTTIMQKVSD